MKFNTRSQKILNEWHLDFKHTSLPLDPELDRVKRACAQAARGDDCSMYVVGIIAGNAASLINGSMPVRDPVTDIIDQEFLLEATQVLDNIREHYNVVTKNDMIGVSPIEHD